MTPAASSSPGWLREGAAEDRVSKSAGTGSSLAR